MPQKPGSLLPLRDRLAIQAEYLTRKKMLPKEERADATIGASIGLTQAAMSKVTRGELGPDVKAALLKAWGTTVAALLKKHHALISRVESSPAPARLLKSIIDNKPTTEQVGATVSDAVDEAAEALSEDEGAPVAEMKLLLLELLREVEPAALPLYRAGRARLGRRSSRPTS